ncbi:MAG: acetylxylan esterase, partial [Bacteroides sp.]|nr:acetylxylan esterase [Bacteroides sp.]
MKKISLLLCWMMCLCLTAGAENYPYRSDVLWVTVPNHADWLYETGEKATVEVQLYKYGIPQDGVTVSYELAGDLMPADAKGEVVLKKGKATIAMGTMKKPGFRDCRMTVKLGNQTYKHHVKVGFSVDKIQPYTQMPSDFQNFWKKNKEELAAFPLTYTKERAEEYCTDKVDCYLVKLQVNKRGQSVYGYLFYPKNAKKGSHPVVLCPPGAGVKTIKEPLRHKYYAEQGCIRLEMEIHGLHPKMTAEQFKEISTAFGSESNYLNINLDNKDNYYMKRVYLACVRAI